MLWCECTIAFDWRVKIHPRSEEFANGISEAVLVLRLVKGALPVRTPKFLSHVANGVSQRPAKYRSLIWVAKLGVGLLAFNFALSEGLKEATCNCDFVLMAESVKEHVGVETQGLDVGGPSLPCQVHFLVGGLSSAVDDSVSGVTIE